MYFLLPVSFFGRNWIESFVEIHPRCLFKHKTASRSLAPPSMARTSNVLFGSFRYSLHCAVSSRDFLMSFAEVPTKAKSLQALEVSSLNSQPVDETFMNFLAHSRWTSITQIFLQFKHGENNAVEQRGTQTYQKVEKFKQRDFEKLDTLAAKSFSAEFRAIDGGGST